MQQSLVDVVAAMDKPGPLVRIKDEVRVDQIPKLMEANPQPVNHSDPRHIKTAG